MFSLWFTSILFGYLFNSMSASNATTGTGNTWINRVKNETGTYSTSTTTPSSAVTGDQMCSSYVSKLPGSLLEPSEEAVISCQCSSTSSCPIINFINGEEYIFVEEKKFELSSGSCSLRYTFRLRSYLRVGKEQLTIACRNPATDDVFGLFDVYTDTPASGNSSSKPRLSVYMVLAIVAFVLLTFAFFGLLVRWRIRSRRRAQRSAHCRSPFVYPQTNLAFSTTTNPGPADDSPPSYNEATLSHNSAMFSKEGLSYNEKSEKCSSQLPTAQDHTATK